MMTTPTKTTQRRISGRISTLHSERKSWIAGKYWPWGTPWCDGPGHPGHQECGCEGCAVREALREIVARIDGEIRQLQESLAPATQGALW